MEHFLTLSQDFIVQYGLLGLCLFAFLEGFINPVPIAPVLGFAVWVFGMPFFPTVPLVFVYNMLGAVFGYYLGKTLGHPASVRLFGNKKIKTAEVFFTKWGDWGVFFSAFTPIPFKVAAWAAGIFEMSFRHFLFAAFWGRLLHFAMIVAVFHFGVSFFKIFS